MEMKEMLDLKIIASVMVAIVLAWGIITLIEWETMPEDMQQRCDHSKVQARIFHLVYQDTPMESEDEEWISSRLQTHSAFYEAFCK